MKNVFISFYIFLAACSSEPKNAEKISEPEKKTVPVISINDKLESRTLKLSEIANVERVVRLETRKDVLIPGYFVPFATDKYIITLDAKQIRQFSSDGKFIRVLSVAGKGPQEYLALTSITLDTHNEILYFTHAGDRKHILVIDLNTGKWLEKIKYPDEFLALPERSLVSNLILMNDSTFLCVPKMMSENKFSTFSMSTSGEFLGSFASHEKYAQIYLNPPVPNCNVILQKIHYLGPDVDTLYEIKNDQKVPVFSLDIADRHAEGLTEGNRRYLSLEGNTFAIMSTNFYKFKKREDGTLEFLDLENISEPIFYFINYKNYTSFSISDFEIDLLGFHDDGFIPLKNIKENFIVYFDAGNFKNKAKQVLKENTVSPEILQRVKELNSQISENDNPILIIGKLK